MGMCKQICKNDSSNDHYKEEISNDHYKEEIVTITRKPLSIKLKISCPQECGCNSGHKQWYFVKCSHECYLDENGDIFCQQKCQTFFLQDAQFICTNKGNQKETKYKQKNLSDFILNLGDALGKQEMNLSEVDKLDFISKALESLRRRWVK